MQTFTDRADDKILVADQIDSDNELLVEAHFSGDEYPFYFSPEAGRALGAAIYSAAGGTGAGPVLASTVSFNEGVLRLATIHSKTVEFRYTKENSSFIETRRFKPSSCTGEGEHFRFVGRDPDRSDAFRSYRLDRVKGTVAVIA